MGRKGRKGVKSKTLAKFHLVHRSQTDSAYQNEHDPSPLVFVPAELTQQERRRMERNINENGGFMQSMNQSRAVSSNSRKGQSNFSMNGDQYEVSGLRGLDAVELETAQQFILAQLQGSSAEGDEYEIEGVEYSDDEDEEDYDEDEGGSDDNYEYIIEAGGEGIDADADNIFKEYRPLKKDKKGAGKDKAMVDHINALGLPNDGYDYSQHLREFTGKGVFFGADGQRAPLPPSAIPVSERERDAHGGDVVNATTDKYYQLLGEDIVPSGREFDRHLEAVTIDDSLMDADLRQALWEDVDEDGEPFEELLDDFVVTAMQEPEEPEFDWDAHIAKLLGESADKTKTVVKEVPKALENVSKMTLKSENLAHFSQLSQTESGGYDDEDDSEGSYLSDSFLQDIPNNENGADKKGHYGSYAESVSSHMSSVSRTNPTSLRQRNKLLGKHNDDDDDHFDLKSEISYAQSALSGLSVSTTTGHKRMSAEERLREDIRFMEVLEGYGDDQLGYIEEVEYESDESQEQIEAIGDDLGGRDEDDEDDNVSHEANSTITASIANKTQDINGYIDLNDETDPMTQRLLQDMDKWYEERKLEIKYATGHMVASGSRDIADLELYKRNQHRKHQASRSDSTHDLNSSRSIRSHSDLSVEEIEELNVKESAYKYALLQQQEEARQREKSVNNRIPTMTQLANFSSNKLEKDNYSALGECQPYLEHNANDFNKNEEWDCETILSTYSTLDNHPRVLADKSTNKYKVHKSRFQVRAEQEALLREATASIVGGRQTLTKLGYEELGRSSDVRSASVYDQLVRRHDQDDESNVSQDNENHHRSSQNIHSNSSEEIEQGIEDLTRVGSQIKPRRIQLGGKLMLPEGYGGTRTQVHNRSNDSNNVDDDITILSSVSKGGKSMLSRLSTQSGNSQYSTGSSMGLSSSSLVRMPMAASYKSNRKSKDDQRLDAADPNRHTITKDNVNNIYHHKGPVGDSRGVVPGKGPHKYVLPATISEEKGDDDEEDDDEEEEEGDNNDDASREYKKKEKPLNLDPNSRRGESAEEKRLRKQRIRQEKALKRANKKALKGVYGAEEERARGGRKKQGQSTDGHSVFRY